MSQPHICPVCMGSQQVNSNLYSPFDGTTTAVTKVMCRTCQGTGMVWSGQPSK